MTKDEKIYKACQSAEDDGFKMLLDAYQEQIYYFIRRMVVVHEDAEDVMQETFIKVFRGLSRYRGDSSLLTWIYRIAMNECLRFLNRKKDNVVSAETVGHTLTDSLMASEYIDYGHTMAVKFQEAILQLSDKQRVVFNLRYYDELEYSEISRITGTKVDTLKVAYHYAKEKIKNYMTEEQI